MSTEEPFAGATRADAGTATIAPGEDIRATVGDRAAEPSIGELFTRLTADTSELLRGEVRLAKAEIKQELKTGAKGVGALGAAGFAGYMALVLLSFAAAWGLAEVIPAGFAFLVVGAVYAAVAVILALQARGQMARFKPVPEQTVETLKEDARWLKRKK